MFPCFLFEGYFGLLGLFFIECAHCTPPPQFAVTFPLLGQRQSLQSPCTDGLGPCGAHWLILRMSVTAIPGCGNQLRQLKQGAAGPSESLGKTAARKSPAGNSRIFTGRAQTVPIAKHSRQLAPAPQGVPLPPMGGAKGAHPVAHMAWGLRVLAPALAVGLPADCLAEPLHV